jgi:glycosyltransferase 2 family protein
MTKRASAILKYLLFFAFSLLLLYLALKDISLVQLVGELKRTNYFWLLLAIAIAMFSHFLRAFRWIILLEPIGYKPSLANTFYAVMVGYFANFAFPRAGEVSRCAMLKKTDNIPVDTGLGTVITERVFDLFTLILLIVFNVLVEKELKKILFIAYQDKIDAITENWILTSLIVFVVILGILTVILLRNFIKNTKLFIRLNTLIMGLMRGVMSFKEVKRKTAFLISTIIMWLCYWGMVQVAVLSYPESANLTILETFTLFIVGGIGMSAPVQGGIGAYHFLVGNLLVIYGFTLEAGIALATILHSTQMIMIIVFGTLSLILILIKEAKRKKDESAHIE